MKRLLFSIGLAIITGTSIGAAAEPGTAWRPGQPQACFKNGEALGAWFKDRAGKLSGHDNLEAGLDSAAMKQLGWFRDNIHLAQPGGQGIGEAIAKLFLP
jgi:hypothetical protein